MLHRAKVTEQIMESERISREISVARDVQMGTLPKNMPEIDGYEFGGAFLPTDQTGGDLYDFIPLGNNRLFMLMGDATGHGIGPALSATQVRAMLRVALRLQSSLDDAFTHINDQLCEDLPDDRFVTGFFGLLDAESHTVRFHSGGQGPIMHYQSDMGEFDWHPATTFPLGYMPHSELDAPHTAALEPGDILGLISDGIYEYENEAGEQFGRRGVMRILDAHPDAGAQELGSQTHVLSTLADGQRELVFVDDRRDDVPLRVGDHLGHSRRSERPASEDLGIRVPRNDVDPFAGQLGHDGLDPGSLEPDARPDRVDGLVVAVDGDLRPPADLAGDLADLHDALGDLPQHLVREVRLLLAHAVLVPPFQESS